MCSQTNLEKSELKGLGPLYPYKDHGIQQIWASDNFRFFQNFKSFQKFCPQTTFSLKKMYYMIRENAISAIKTLLGIVKPTQHWPRVKVFFQKKKILSGYYKGFNHRGCRTQIPVPRYPGTQNLDPLPPPSIPPWIGLEHAFCVLTPLCPAVESRSREHLFGIGVIRPEQDCSWTYDQPPSNTRCQWHKS